MFVKYLSTFSWYDQYRSTFWIFNNSFLSLQLMTNEWRILTFSIPFGVRASVFPCLEVFWCSSFTPCVNLHPISAREARLMGEMTPVSVPTLSVSKCLVCNSKSNFWMVMRWENASPSAFFLTTQQGDSRWFMKHHATLSLEEQLPKGQTSSGFWSILVGKRVALWAFSISLPSKQLKFQLLQRTFYSKELLIVFKDGRADFSKYWRNWTFGFWRNPIEAN